MSTPRLRWPFSDPFWAELDRAITASAEKPLTIEELEAMLREFDPAGNKMATAKLLTAIEGLSAQQIDTLTSVAKAIGSEPGLPKPSGEKGGDRE